MPPFIPLPRFMLAGEYSINAKLLYGLLLNRTMLSQKSGWVSEDGNVYVIYTIKQMANDLDRSERTVKTALRELENAGLITRVRQGWNQANRISHEAFVSKEDFDKVQEIKAIRGKKGNHNIGQYNAHLLSGIVKCPQCGAPMYIGMTKWTNQDGTERRTESYVCSYATKHRGTSVCRRNGVVASQVEDEVMEYTRKIVRNPQFIKDLQEKVMTAVDMTEVENDITAYKNQLSALQRSRDSLEQDIDRIAPDDKYAERRRADMTRRLNDLYDQIYKAEDLLQESLMKKTTLESEQMSVQSLIGILSSFDAIYDRMNAAERRDLVKYLISEVELFPREEQKTQKRFVKAIAYKFPIEQKVLTQFDECGASVETVVRLKRNK